MIESLKKVPIVFICLSVILMALSKNQKAEKG